jgi:prepilin-type N-terminal cleavage/methylation domain-containing protein
MNKSTQTGFTLIEIAIVLIIVSILLGYTVAMLPRQQELKQYRAVKRQMDQVIEAVIGFAQVNGRLPCPAIPNSAGIEDFDNDGGLPDGCYNNGGFVPVNTLGLSGRLNADSLLQDPWGNPYRYYVTNVDFVDPISGTNGVSDFTGGGGEMRSIGLVDSDADGYIDLDGRYLICNAASAINNLCTAGTTPIFGNPDGAGQYAGAPFVLLSQGKNWSEPGPSNDEVENSGASTTATLGMTAGPSAATYVLKNVVVGNETTFVRPRAGFSDNFDDVVRWASPSILFSRMIQAGQLP